MNENIDIKKNHEDDLTNLNSHYNWISICRFLVFLILAFLIYKSLSEPAVIYFLGSLAFAALFFYCLKLHEKIFQKRNITKTLIDINTKEIQYLQGDGIPFQNGMEHTDSHHFYTYDLDIFGNHSLFQHINRTYTYIGNRTLANLLSTKLNNANIIENQETIRELAPKITWRQRFAAHAIITNDNRENYEKIIDWSHSTTIPISKIHHVLCILMPLMFIASLVVLYIKGSDYFQLTSTLFTLNLLIAFSLVKKIKKELISSDQIPSILSHYGHMLNMIENEKYNSSKLKAIQSQLILAQPVSESIKRLSVLYSNVQSVQNLMGAIIMNGVFLYHVSQLIKLLEWKNQHGPSIQAWIKIIGEVETMNSLANFAHNNPSFCFPDLNDNFDISFEQFGHPLIRQNKRICNDVAFHHKTMIILTGSNMSGKSTFLRTLGINMVLTGVGSVVCATKANIHPLEVIVSMRQTDSLSDSESYFFAEVKRLKQIMDRLVEKKCFVLLDEILKGTNSDDKQTGTIAIIKKMIHLQAIGAVATHDLEVCKTTEEYPDILTNQCFEVAIINDELVFDYKLRQGICQNKSATFLMKKMDVI
jgi:hypothetical protein